MKKGLIKQTNLYGTIPKNNKPFDDLGLYIKDFSLPSTILKKIQIWFGIPRKDMPVSLLGIKCWYLNHVTGEKKESEYHGCELKKDNIESKELEIKGNDYFTKINFGIPYYIIHFKISTKNGHYIEFGEIKEEYEKKIELNPDDNIISFFSGYTSRLGVRALKINYISRVNFVFYRIIDILRLRHFLKKHEKIKEFYLAEENFNKLSFVMKYLFHVCLLPDTVLSCIVKYL